MATNKTLNTITLSSAEFAAIGMPLDISSDNVKLSNQLNIDAGAAFVNNDPLISVAVAQIRNDMRAAETGRIRASIALALLEEHDAWRSITAPDGKPFRNVQAFRRMVFAGYEESSVRKYADAGRRVYLAALRGELSDIPLDIIEMSNGNIIKALPMRTASALKAGLTDEQTRAKLPDIIKEDSIDGRISYKSMNNAVKKAKEASGQSASAPETETPVATESDVDAALISAETKRCLVAFVNSDELTISCDADNVKRLKNLIGVASKTGDNALLFVKELANIIDNAR